MSREAAESLGPRFALVVCLVLAGARVVAGADSPDAAMEKAFAAQLVLLNDDDWLVRQRASDAIAAMPGEVAPLVERTLRQNDLSPEVQDRLSGLIGDLRGKLRASNVGRKREQAFTKYRDFVLTEYDRAGRRDPKWDAAAHEAIVLYLAAAKAPGVGPQAPVRAAGAIEKCVRLGCDDPLIALYNVLQLTAGPNRSLDFLEEVDRLTPRMLSSGYAPQFKAMALLTRARMRANDGPVWAESVQRDRYLRDLDDALAILPQMGGRPSPGDDTAGSIGLTLMKAYGGGESGDAHRDAIAAALGKATTDPLARLLFTARADIFLSETESNAAARQHLDHAFAAASDALKIDRHSLEAARLRLASLDPSTRPQEFQAAYDTALAIDPKDPETRQIMLRAILLRDDEEATLAFADECLNTNAWAERTPLVAATACRRLAERRVDSDRAAYLSRPDMWRRIERAYTGVLYVYPKDAKIRSEYLRFACEAEKWSEANRQFKILGGDLEPDAVGGDAMVDYLKEKAQRLAVSDHAQTPVTPSGNP